MKTLTTQIKNDIFNEFVLSTEEMTKVRGGDSDQIIKSTIPPIIV
jgi:hypothetical protein